MSGLDSKTKAYVPLSVEKLFFDIESSAYSTVVAATQYHPVQQSQSFLKTSATI